MLLKSLRIFVIATIVLGASVTLAAVPEQTVQAATTVTYNLFATDGFTKMADGTPLYNYGFVGGRAGKPFTFQKSFSADGLTGGENDTSFTMGAPTPAGGPITPAEFKLAGNTSFPGPLIYATVGDVVEIRLKNLGVTYAGAPNDPHSIHLHGLDVDAANDGVPETSIGAVPANLCADGSTAPAGENCANPAPGAGNVIVYMFSPKNAGSYFYHCHQEADIHVQMGMYGALVIYNKGDPAASTGPGSGRGGTLFGWKYDKDYVLLESEVDLRQHCSEQGTYTAAGLCQDPADVTGVATLPTLPGQTIGWNPVDYKPQYWFLNGLSFPSTVHVTTGAVLNWDNWIAAHPGYDPFITGSVNLRSADGSKGQKVLIRMINMGFETQPMHMHGFHGKVIGSDQRGWYWANTPYIQPWGAGEEKNTLTIGSGEEYDWLLNFGLVSVTSTYQTGTQSRFNPDANNLPVTNTDTTKPVIDPYVAGPVVTGSALGGAPGQLFPFHNHDDYKATNNGTYPGGMFTMIMPTN